MMERAKVVLAGGPFPTLGDKARTFAVELTEPEINAIHAAVAFVGAACKDWPTGLGARYWSHYGPTLDHLSERLAIFDDPPASVASVPGSLQPPPLRQPEAPTPACDQTINALPKDLEP